MNELPPNARNSTNRENPRHQQHQPENQNAGVPLLRRQQPAATPRTTEERNPSPIAMQPIPILRTNRSLVAGARAPGPTSNSFFRPIMPYVVSPTVPGPRAPRAAHSFATANETNPPTTTRGNPPRAEVARPLNNFQQQVNERIVEIILTLQKNNEYVSRERVQEDLFRHYKVHSWQDLNSHPSLFVPLSNLTDRQKSVTFYVQILEQTFNMCTLHDLEPLLVKFMKVDHYDELHLGPLSKHPKIQEIFDYHPTDDDQSVPAITTGDIIKTFIDFQRSYRGGRPELFEKFLDGLVKKYGLQNRSDLGFFCKSFPYLVQVTANVRRDHDFHQQQIMGDAREELLEDVRAQLDELKEKMRDVSHLSVFNEKKTPTAVFNYLASIIEKFFPIVPQQSILYAVLALLRDNELLRYLLNLSIYLAVMEQPEALTTEFNRLYQEQHPRQDLADFEQRLVFDGELNNKDRRKMKALTERRKSKQSQPQVPGAPTDGDEGEASSSLTSNRSAFQRQKRKPPISLRELCAEIKHVFMHTNAALSLQQLLDVEKYLCDQHGVNDFSEFNYDEYDGAENSVNLVSFLDRYREKIDPEQELTIYDRQTSGGLREEFLPFVQQLSILHHDDHHNDQDSHHPVSAHGDLNTGQKRVSKETWSVVDKALKHRFGESVSFSQGKQLIKRAMQSKHSNQYPILHFEESLLDVNGLNRLDVCPSSLNVDYAQLCDLILRAPLMTDLNTWLQWSCFFQPKYGSLSSFIASNEIAFQQLSLLETSTHELVRLPSDASLSSFERELNAMHVRSAVGHLCALIVQEGMVTRFSFNIYRTSMETWFRQLRSLAALHNERFNALGYILDFLTYFPSLIGQSRVIDELVIGPLDHVFGDEPGMTSNARARLWNAASTKQRSKLELWGYTLNINEWKNEEKWSGTMDFEETSEIEARTETPSSKPVLRVDPNPKPTLRAQLSVDPQRIEPVTTIADPKPSYSGADDDSTQAALEHIESIRRGLGVTSDLDSASQSIVSNLQGVIKRSLEKISTDLYSEEGHFVLELIQNADDNQYEGVTPTLRFHLSSTRILVCNNELGFQPSNISAICNVGASTKGKHKQGYAGHKGIGFKSVFMVSNRPEIHSQNYHICFDTGNADDRMGYIRPIWVNEAEEDLPDPKEWPTCIRLPIKSDARGDRLQQKFENIQARLLLFLNRLRQIEIIQEPDSTGTSGSSRIFSRIDHANGQIIELQEKVSNGTVTSELWLVVKEVIEVPANIKDKLRDIKGDVDYTTIAIAYPLNSIEQASSALPPSQPLFAYLPLCSYGFRFILQADFEIPANRQDIRRDNLWNEWLKSEMPQLLYRAYLQFQRLPELLASLNIDGDRYHHLTPIQTIKYFLRLIPSRHELNPYFHSFIDKSIQLLTGIMKLPVARSANADDGQIDWILPSQCILVQDPLIRKVLSQDLLLAHLNSYYVHEQLVAECDDKVLIKLGCRPLDFSDITQLMELSYKPDEREHLKTPATIEQIAQWLVCLDFGLQQQREQMQSASSQKKKSEETIAKLKQMKIIPLRLQPHFVSIDQFEKNTILFPFEKSQKYSKDLRLVLDDVPIIDEQLLNFIEDKHSRRIDSIKKLLRDLGVRENPRIHDIFRQHMLPVMSDPARWSSKPEDVLIAYLICTYRYLYASDSGLTENDLKQLQKSALIKTRDKKFISLSTPGTVVHLTSTYGCRGSLESLALTNYRFNFIADDYFNQYSTELFQQPAQRNKFRTFLQEIGLSEFLQVTPTDHPFTEVSKLADTQWAHLMKKLSELIDEPFIIKDYICDEFDRLVSPTEEHPKGNRELCIQLFQYLHNYYRIAPQYYTASVVSARRQRTGQAETILGVESTFCLALRQHAWIPVDGGELMKPADVYCLPRDNDAFRRYVPHLDLTKLVVTDENFIIDIVGLHKQVAPQTMFELLMKWSCDLDSASLWKLIKSTKTETIPCTLPTTFRQSHADTIDNLCHIYNFLASIGDTQSLLGRFRLWPLVFIPRDEKNGQFFFARQLYWQDPIFQLAVQDTLTDSSGRIAISPHYDDGARLVDLFLRILQVEMQPTIDDYLPLLAAAEDTEKNWRLIEIIAKLAIEQQKELEVQEKCRDIAFIPCISYQKKLVKYTDHPIYPDDMDMAELFADTLSIIKPPNFALSPESKANFCSLFEIEDLAEVIRTEVKVENEQPSVILGDFYRRSIDLIQAFLLNEKLLSESRSTDLASVFARMHFVCVDLIQVSYCYEGNPKKSVDSASSNETYIDEKAGKFYILKKFENSDMRYIDAMVAFLLRDETSQSKLSSYMKKLLQTYQKNSDEGLKKLREKLTIQCESKWIIPEEVKKDVPPAPVKQQREEQKVLEPVVITAEEKAALLCESSLRPAPQPKEPTTEEKERSVITSYPMRGPTAESTTQPTGKSTGQGTGTRSDGDSTDSNRPRQANADNHEQRSDHEQSPHEHRGDHEQSHHEPGPPRAPATESTIDREANREEATESKDPLRQTTAPVTFSADASLPPISFSNIAVSNLTDLDLSMFSPTTAVNTRSTGSEADLVTGHQGEELVFRILSREYPTDEVKWVNADSESGKPFDIYLKLANQEAEFIEVKTTRAIDQHTFPVSIGEVKFFLEHSMNYHIYRVYLADQIGRSTITKIHKLEENLKQKHLKLSMTVMSKPSE